MKSNWSDGLGKAATGQKQPVVTSLNQQLSYRLLAGWTLKPAATEYGETAGALFLRPNRLASMWTPATGALGAEMFEGIQNDPKVPA